jgi:hypothetical protein
MRISEIINKKLLDNLVRGHNSQDDQVWERTLSTRERNGVIEVIGVDNYGNAYFVQVANDNRHRIDWIRKSDVGEKHSNVLPEHYRVSDEVLNKYRRLL